MENENLRKFALIAEIIGGLAVVTSLAILVFEIQGNTRALQASTYDSIVADLANARYENSRNESTMEAIFVRSSEGFDALTPKQSHLLDEQALALFQIYERAFIQWESGNLDDRAWVRFSRVICQASGDVSFEEQLGPRLDRLTTDSFTEYRKNQC
jgi:hypothetical protein